jgi:F0F1-type ATP synthase membrane subunit b/b'
VWDGTVVRIKDAEDQATQVEREAQERVSRMEEENAAALASTREDIEGHVRKVALLEGELAEAHQAREVAEENFCGLFDEATGGVHEGTPRAI